MIGLESSFTFDASKTRRTETAEPDYHHISEATPLILESIAATSAGADADATSTSLVDEHMDETPFAFEKSTRDAVTSNEPGDSDGQFGDMSQAVTESEVTASDGTGDGSSENL